MNISDIRTDILKTLDTADQSVELVAVSKRQPQEKIIESLNAGQRIFGENRVQEAYDHWNAIKDNNQYPDLKLHLIGSLQSNKSAEAVKLFDVIETVDRPKIAKSLAQEMQKQSRQLPCYIQVNTGEEPQKSGVIPADLPEFVKYCQDECGLDIVGLMCIPPADDPTAIHFAFLHKLATENNLEKLSMGMSADYEKAIDLGATSVRIGSAFFGERQN